MAGIPNAVTFASLTGLSGVYLTICFDIAKANATLPNSDGCRWKGPRASQLWAPFVTAPITRTRTRKNKEAAYIAYAQSINHLQPINRTIKLENSDTTAHILCL